MNKREPIVQTTKELERIGEYSILMQALALGETITVNVGRGDIEIWMDKGYELFASNLNFPDLPTFNYSEELTLSVVVERIIPKLKKQEPKEFKDFTNRWEELKTITEDALGFNKYKESMR